MYPREMFRIVRIAVDLPEVQLSAARGAGAGNFQVKVRSHRYIQTAPVRKRELIACPDPS
jgi:hypothetical protein